MILVVNGQTEHPIHLNSFNLNYLIGECTARIDHTTDIFHENIEFLVSLKDTNITKIEVFETDLVTKVYDLDQVFHVDELTDDYEAQQNNRYVSLRMSKI